MSKRLRIYLAGPISGMSKVEVFEYWDKASVHFSELGYEVYSPMTGKDYFRTEAKSETFKPAGYNNINPISSDHAITHRDMWMVNMVDIIFANLENSKAVSIGTVSEIAWGKAFGKQVVVAMEDGNIHDHAFVRENATIVLPTADDARNYLKDLIG